MTRYEDITDPSLAKALAHPLRSRILAALEGRTASPSELAGELEAPLGVLSYHVRRLSALGFVKQVKRVPRRGAVEHYYTVTSRPKLTDATWATTPSIVKQATVAPRLEVIGAEASAALVDGGFDAAETHLSRTRATVDAEGWRELSSKLEAVLGDIGRIEAESKERLARADHQGEQDVSVVLMLFHRAAATAGAQGEAAGRDGRRAKRGAAGARRG